MANKASTDKLNKLHDLVATYYADTLGLALEEGAELSSGTLNAINSFLKNNDITADPIESQPMQNLTYRIQDLIEKEKEAI